MRLPGGRKGQVPWKVPLKASWSQSKDCMKSLSFEWLSITTGKTSLFLLILKIINNVIPAECYVQSIEMVSCHWPLLTPQLFSCLSSEFLKLSLIGALSRGLSCTSFTYHREPSL